MAERTTRRRLDQPAATRRGWRLDVDTEWFARAAERLARFLGTGTYLLWQTIFVIVWIILNVVMVARAWDPYPFILLNLAFSTQAAYAAPLILLAQNRQDDRDRVALEEDRTRAARTTTETEYLARELAALRLALGEVVTRDFLRSELDRGGDRDGRTDRGLDRETQKALGRTVETAVDKALEKAVGRAVDKHLDEAVERSVARAMERAGGPGGARSDERDGADGR